MVGNAGAGSQTESHGYEEYDGRLQGIRVRTVYAVVFGLAAFAVQCCAEPRWCSTQGIDPSNKFFYPPIARAARVSGVVISRMIYPPNGRVVEVVPVSGSSLLSSALTGQLMQWTVKTDSTGDELCQTLVIAEFKLVDSNSMPPVRLPQSEPPSILRLSAETEPIPIEVVNYDPAPLRGWKAVRVEIGYRLRRTFARMFGAPR